MNLIFRDYTIKYNKTYNSSEYLTRKTIFSNNYEYILNKNEKLSYNLGINNFTDYTQEEFKNIYLNGLKLNTIKHKFYYHNISNTTNSIPLSIDWRADGVVTNVKNQGQCGSCWAFSTTGTVEGQHAKVYKNLVSLSEQNLVDCSQENYGCDGGWPLKAMEYIQKNGVDSESSYNYVGYDESCEYNKTNVGSYLKDIVLVESGNVSSLYDAIGRIGPISIAIDAEDDFQFYSSGIYESTICNSDIYSLNHAVLAVGYSYFNNKTFIIVKNSWDTTWGMDGYIYMSTNISNICGMATNASYPIV